MSKPGNGHGWTQASTSALATTAEKLHCVLGGVVLLFAAASPISAAEIILDGGFETPSLAGTPNGFCYPQPSVSSVNCVSEGVETSSGNFGPWQAGASAAVTKVGGASWGLNGLPADGTQFGVLQGAGSWLQSIAIPATGNYLLTWWDAGRTNPLFGWDGNQRYVVMIDGLGAIATLSTTSGQVFTRHALALTLTQGLHSLRFAGLISSGDHSSYLDAVSLTPVPEPTTAGLLAVGLVCMLGMLRRGLPRGHCPESPGLRRRAGPARHPVWLCGQ